MSYSQNPILKEAGFEALPKSMTKERTSRIGDIPQTLNEEERRKAEICVKYYYYLMTHFENTQLFKEVYKSFYLRNTHRGNSKWSENDYRIYFEKMFSFESTNDCVNDVKTIVEYLQNNLSKGRYELSFSTKLVHTVNPNTPIFDSGVCKYLKKFEGFSLPINSEKKYKALYSWYDNFIKNDPRYHNWLRWFDETFPSYSEISDIKKIDFVLFLGK